ncbi:diadenosine tetraphosphate hydrolase [Labrys sp. WJW]|uniref:HIT family protein n=1 Tax=Labrys sp. WJW TaxID=1737983 RepID=UPI00082D0743|nr:HIT family protein [Labrys sp. WJW]OCC03408.1 diadenosine tetraphosphate hydrolase [Labrys sp. WJW]
MPPAFILHSQLAGDSIAIGDLALSQLRLINDASFPWLLLIPRRPDISEIIELDEADRAVLMQEIAAVSQALKTLTGCDKLNVAALGNMVLQLHIHVIARFKGDPAWPKPVWGQVPARPYAEAVAADLISQLRRLLPIS